MFGIGGVGEANSSPADSRSDEMLELLGGVGWAPVASPKQLAVPIGNPIKQNFCEDISSRLMREGRDDINNKSGG